MSEQEIPLEAIDRANEEGLLDFKDYISMRNFWYETKWEREAVRCDGGDL